MAARTTVASLAALALVAGASAAEVQTRPSLGVIDLQPLTIRGKAFAPEERVLVRVAKSGRAWVRRALVSDAGTFRIRFPVAVERCESFTARASGSSGTLAVLPVRLRLDCVSDDA